MVNNEPRVQGGQGRTEQSLHDSAWGIVTVALVCLALAAVLCLFCGCAAAERYVPNLSRPPVLER